MQLQKQQDAKTTIKTWVLAFGYGAAVNARTLKHS